MIKLKNISKSFRTRDGSVTVLNDISLTVNDGEIHGIIGLSGAGKSTLARCVNLLERPDSGSIIIDGVDITGAKGKALNDVRKKIGMIFQSYNLLEQRTALGNVTFPLELSGTPKKLAEERALTLLELVGLKDKAKSYPAALSGGQKQRVAIARALATNPSYLILDEATSALDPETTAAIIDLIKKINRESKVTVLVITHEMNLIYRLCDVVTVLDNGSVVESGRTEDVFDSPKSARAKSFLSLAFVARENTVPGGTDNV